MAPSWCARTGTPGGDRRLVRGVGAERPVRPGGRRLQRLGRPAAPDAGPRRLRRVGAVSPGRHAGCAVQVRGSQPAGAPRAAQRPVRLRHRGATRDGQCGDRKQLPVAGRGLARRPGSHRPAHCAPQHLRMPPRLLAAQAGRRRDLAPADLPGTRRGTAGVPGGDELHPRAAAAGRRTSLRRLLGLPGHRLLRADRPPRHPGRPSLSHRPAAPGRDRRPGGLGDRPLPQGRLGAGPLRRHRPLRTRRPPPGRAPRLGHAGLQLRPPGGAELPPGQRAVLDGGVPSRRAAGRRGRLHALPRLSRQEGEWVTNRFGGRENLDAIDLIKEINEVVYRHHPDVMMIAEESTTWPAVSRPTSLGGLGFGFKWNMGWMNDTLVYFAKDPVHRRHHHHELTFALLYAFHENFVLPLSHDEVAHGKGSLLGKMPGDRWQQFANLRALLTWMWAHPGRPLLFMGGEIAQNDEWHYDRSIDWHLLDHPEHAGMQALVRELNTVYRREPALWEQDFDWTGFRWIDPNDADHSVLSFLRIPITGQRAVACVANLTPVVRHNYRIGLPHPGRWVEILNSDSARFGGSDVLAGDLTAEAISWNDLDYSATLTLPPLAIVWLAHEADIHPPAVAR